MKTAINVFFIFLPLLTVGAEPQQLCNNGVFKCVSPTSLRICFLEKLVTSEFSCPNSTFCNEKSRTICSTIPAAPFEQYEDPNEIESSANMDNYPFMECTEAGLFAVEKTGCTTYLNCLNSEDGFTTEELTCNEVSLFDPEQKICSEDYICSDILEVVEYDSDYSLPNTAFNCTKVGQFPLPNSNCANFVYCKYIYTGFKPIVKPCPFNTLFDPTLGKCVKGYICKDGITTTTISIINTSRTVEPTSTTTHVHTATITEEPTSATTEELTSTTTEEPTSTTTEESTSTTTEEPTSTIFDEPKSTTEELTSTTIEEPTSTTTEEPTSTAIEESTSKNEESTSTIIPEDLPICTEAGKIPLPSTNCTMFRMCMNTAHGFVYKDYVCPAEHFFNPDTKRCSSSYQCWPISTSTPSSITISDSNVSDEELTSTKNEKSTSTTTEEPISTTIEESTTTTTKEPTSIITAEPSSTTTEKLTSTTTDELTSTTTEKPTSTTTEKSTSANTEEPTSTIIEVPITTTTQELTLTTTKESALTTTKEPTSIIFEEPLSTTTEELTSTTTEVSTATATEEPMSTIIEEPISTTTEELTSTKTEDHSSTTTEEPTSTTTENLTSTTAEEPTLTTTEESTSTTTEEPSSTIFKQPISTTTEELSSTTTENPSSRATEEPTSTTTAESSSTTTEESTSTTTEEPKSTIIVEPISTTTEELTSTTTEEPISTTTEEPISTTTEKSTSTKTEEPSSTIIEVPISTTTKESTSTTTKEPTSIITEETVSTTTEVSTETTTNEPMSTTIEETISTTTEEPTSTTTEALTSTATEETSSTTEELTSTIFPEDLPICTEAGKIPLPSTNCTMFRMCMNAAHGFVYKDYACPAGNFFNPETKRCSSSYLCLPISTSTASAITISDSTVSDEALSSTKTEESTSTTTEELALTTTEESTTTTTKEPTSIIIKEPISTTTAKLTSTTTDEPTSTTTEEPTSTSTEESTSTTTEEPTSTIIEETISITTEKLTSTITEESTTTTTEEPTSTILEEPISTTTEELTLTKTEESTSTTTEEPSSTINEEPISTTTEKLTSTKTEELTSTKTEEPSSTIIKESFSTTTEERTSTKIKEFTSTTTEEPRSTILEEPISTTTEKLTSSTTEESTLTTIEEPTSTILEEPISTSTEKLTSSTTEESTSTTTEEPTSTIIKKPTSTTTEELTSTITAKSSSTTAEELTSTIFEEPISTTTEELTSTITKEPASTTTEEATSTTTDELTSTTIEEPTSTTTEEPTSTTTEESTTTTTEEPTSTIFEEPLSTTTEEHTLTTTKDPLSTTTEEPTSTTTEETTSTTTEESTSKTTEEPTSTIFVEPISTTTEELTSTTIEQPTSTTTEEPTSTATEESTSTTEESTSTILPEDLPICTEAGKIPLPSTNCTMFRMCMNTAHGFVYKDYACPAEHFFNPDTKRCSSSYQCWPISTSTASSITISSSTVSDDITPSSSDESITTDLSTNNSNSEEEGSKSPTTTTTFYCTEEDRIPVLNTNCTMYSECTLTTSGYKYITYKCPESSSYDPKNQICSNIYSCSDSGSNTTTDQPTSDSTITNSGESSSTSTSFTTVTEYDVPLSSTEETINTLNCTEQGKIPVPNTNCTTYGQCTLTTSGFQQSVYLCPGDTLFDPINKICSNSYTCTDSNSDTSTEHTVSEPTQSTENDIFTTNSDESSSTSTSFTTVTEYDVPLSSTEETMNTLNCTEQGKIPVPNTNCTTYGQCTLTTSGFQQSVYLCPGDTLFDPINKICSNSYTCTDSNSDTTTEHTVSEPTQSTVNDIFTTNSGESSSTSTSFTIVTEYDVPLSSTEETIITLNCTEDGKISVPNTNCRIYGQCTLTSSGFQQSLYLCPEDTLFDPINKNCSDTYNCCDTNIITTTSSSGTEMVNSTPTPPVCDKQGKFPILNTKCKKYLSCILTTNGFKSTEYKCSDAQLFDPNFNKCSSNYICTEESSYTLNENNQSIKPEKTDSEPEIFNCTESGKIPVSNSKCSQYVLCSQTANGFMSKIYTCPIDSYYDPETKKCSKTYSCIELGTTSNTEVPSTTTSEDLIDIPKCYENGKFFINNTGCSSYVLCSSTTTGFKSKVLSCPTDSYFNPDVKQCQKEYICLESSTIDEPSTATESLIETTTECNETPLEIPVCTKKGRFPVKGSKCKQYVLCKNTGLGFKSKVHTCPNKTKFNPNQNKCIVSYKCPEKKCDKKNKTKPNKIGNKVKTTKCKKAGKFSIKGSNCTKFKQCVSSKVGFTKTIKNCPKGTYFNPRLQLCSANYVCNANLKLDCPTIGRFKDTNDTTCQYYVECEANSKNVVKGIRKNCRKDYYFDPRIQTCSATYMCKSKKQVSTKFIINGQCTTVGRYAVPGTNCKNYLHCVDNGGGTLKGTNFVCPTTSVFNQVIQKCTATYVCPDSVCRSPGPTPNPNAKDCSSYINCDYYTDSKGLNGGYTGRIVNCPVGQKFDPMGICCSSDYVCRT